MHRGMDCHGQWISLTTLKFSCQDQAQQRTETPANRLSAAVSITMEPRVHRSKGTKRVCITSWVDFHWFINYFLVKAENLPRRKVSVHSFSPLFELNHPAVRGKLWETKGTSKPLALLFHRPVCWQMCHSRGDLVCGLLGGRRLKGTFWTFSFAQLPFQIKLIRNWFFETCQAWLKLPSSFINSRWRAGGKKSPERYENNHSHKHRVTVWTFSLGNGAISLFQLVNSFCQAHLLSHCPLPTGIVTVVLCTSSRAEDSTSSP